MIRFALVAPRETLFGRGARARAAAEVAARGRTVVLVRGRAVAWVDTFAAELRATGLTVLEVEARGEPSLDQLAAALDRVRPLGADCVVAVGGGAVIDLGKALAALLPATGDPVAHLEVVGEGRPIGPDPLPFVALPTTAGTGAEATKNAVISVPDKALKVSLRDDRMVPDLAIVDPALTDNAPRALTLATGLDAVTQLIESYLSIRANPVTDALCRDAIPGAVAALDRLMTAEDPVARDTLARASHLSGIALANAGLGIVHGLAAVIGGRGAAHGAICGRLLPAALEVNQRVAAGQGLDTGRFGEVDAWLRAGLGGEAGRGTERLRRFIDAHGLPGLVALGCPASEVAPIAGQALKASSTRANPVPLDAGAVAAILDATF